MEESMKNPLRILLVDDEADDILSIQQLLGKHRVALFEDLLIAIEYI